MACTLSNSNSGNSVTVRYERDTTGVLMRVTEDGIRTHTKFIYDDVHENTSAPQHDMDVQAADVDMDYDEDETRSLTPKAESVSELSLAGDFFAPLPDPPTVQRPRSGSISTQTSGPLGVNHWARQAPVMPNRWADAGGSDLATEIIPVGQQTRFPSMPPPAKAMSHLSGMTQPPPSEGRAGPGSTYFPYQGSRTRTFHCVNPGIAKRAEAMKLIQRCDATSRNLGVSSVPENVSFELRSTDGDLRFASPCPSGQVHVPSLFSREGTPVDTQLGAFREGMHSNGERPPFDYATWKWLNDLKEEPSAESSTATAGTVNSESFSRESSPLTELSDSEIADDEQKSTGLHEPPSPSFHVSGFFSRENSPLTEYDYSVMGSPRPIRKELQLPTPQSSPKKGYERTEPVMTRRRARQQEANH